MYTHSHIPIQARVCVHLVFFESICVGFNCAEPIIIDINVWHEREGRMKYSKLSDMFSLHYLLDQKCLCACDMCASPPSLCPLVCTARVTFGRRVFSVCQTGVDRASNACQTVAGIHFGKPLERRLEIKFS